MLAQVRVDRSDLAMLDACADAAAASPETFQDFASIFQSHAIAIADACGLPCETTREREILLGFVVGIACGHMPGATDAQPDRPGTVTITREEYEHLCNDAGVLPESPSSPDADRAG
jgi:hypothetical protein